MIIYCKPNNHTKKKKKRKKEEVMYFLMSAVTGIKLIRNAYCIYSKRE